MDASSGHGSFVDKLLRFEPGRMVVNSALLDDILEHYERKAKPLLDNYAVERMMAQMTVIGVESQAQAMRAARRDDVSLLLRLEAVSKSGGAGVTFPLTQSDRAIGSAGKNSFSSQKLEELYEGFQQALFFERYYRAPQDSKNMPEEPRYTRQELVKALHDAEILGYPVTLMVLSKAESEYNSREANRDPWFEYEKAEGRREGRYRMACMRCGYEERLLGVLTQFLSDQKVRLPAETLAGAERLVGRLQENVKNAEDFKYMAWRIVQEEALKRGGPAWEESHLVRPIYTTAQMGRIAEYISLEANPINPLIKEHISDAFRGDVFMKVKDQSPPQRPVGMAAPHEDRFESREVVLSR